MNRNMIEKLYEKFESGIILILGVSITLAIAYATFIFLVLLTKSVLSFEQLSNLFSMHSFEHGIGEPIERLQMGLYKVFGGFLLILLGIELINTVRFFSNNNHIKMESIVAISIIATSRHLITLDYHHTEPMMIFAIGFVVLSLISGYFLLRYQTLKHTLERKTMSYSKTQKTAK